MLELLNKYKDLFIKGLVSVIVIICFIGIFSTLFEKCSGPNNKAFIAQIDSLKHVNDSLKKDIVASDSIISLLGRRDDSLKYKIAHFKPQVITIIKYVDSSKSRIDSLKNNELVTVFNKRYPQDTTSIPLILARPVLVAAAKDLIELDGAKEILKIKDTIISLNEIRIIGKDSIITKYKAKEINYKNIMVNQYNQIQGWEDQYGKLEIQYNKLKVKSKFQRIGSYIVIGGLAYLFVIK
jgi:hypothetical protein